MYDYNDTKVIANYLYDVPPGWFSNDHANWQSCRDYWFPYSLEFPWFFFSHQLHRGGHAAAFVGEIERRLMLEERSRFGGVIVGRNRSDGVTWVEASSFWLRHPMRRSLFTLLLRAGTAYNAESPTDSSLGDAVCSSPLLAPTWNAFWRFVDGYTYCQTAWPTTWREHVAYGWAVAFHNITWDDACQRLKHPNEIAERKSYFKWHDAGRPNEGSEQFWRDAMHETEWPCGIPLAITQRANLRAAA